MQARVHRRGVGIGAGGFFALTWVWLASAEYSASRRTSRQLASLTEAQAVEFNRDIRPILADNCYACHGPDKNQRKADLRLDIKEGASADRGGYQAVVP